MSGMKLISVVMICLMMPGVLKANDKAMGWSWAGIAAATLENQTGPAPAPAPQPGDVCQTCSGTGKVGDGRVFQACKDCDGTGKVAGVKKVVQKIGQACEGGQCPLPKVIISTPQAVLQRSTQDQVICEGNVCYPAPAYKPYVVRQQSVKIIRRGFIFRR